MAESASGKGEGDSATDDGVRGAGNGKRPVSVRRRSASRLAAVQTLFQVWARDLPSSEVIPSFRAHFLPALLEDFGIDRIDEDHYSGVVTGALDRIEEIDAVLVPLLKDGWTLERLGSVDRSALRAAVIELQSMPHVPARTVAGEYTAITEACGGDHAFVNAVLDRLARDLREGEMARP